MKEFEEFAKAVSLGMKALAKIIETAAEQLEEQVTSHAKTGKAEEAPKSARRKNSGKNSAKAEKAAAPEAKTTAAEVVKAPEPAAEKPRAKKARKSRAVKAGKSAKAKPRKPSDTATVYMHIQAAEDGIFTFVRVMGMISFSLGIINLLPVPVLDGGQIVFYAIEGIRGRPLPLVLRERIQMVGVLFLAALMVMVFVMDVSRWLES